MPLPFYPCLSATLDTCRAGFWCIFYLRGFVLFCARTMTACAFMSRLSCSIELAMSELLVVFACRPTHPFFNRRRPSFSGRRFPTVEHAAAERHVGVVTHCFAGNDRRLISSIVPSVVPCGNFVISDTIIVRFTSSYLLTLGHITVTLCNKWTMMLTMGVYERSMEFVVSATGGLSESWPKYSMFVHMGRVTSGSETAQRSYRALYENMAAKGWIKYSTIWT